MSRVYLPTNRLRAFGCNGCIVSIRYESRLPSYKGKLGQANASCRVSIRYESRLPSYEKEFAKTKAEICFNPL